MDAAFLRLFFFTLGRVVGGGGGGNSIVFDVSSLTHSDSN